MRRYPVAIAAALAVAAVAAAVAVPGVVSTRWAKAKIAESVGAWTGGAVTIRGEATVTVLPSVAIEVKDVRVSRPPGAGGPPLMTVPSLKVSLAVRPLLLGRVEAKTLTLVDPQVHLDPDDAGRADWTGRLWRAAAGRPPAGAQFDELILHGGTITWEDRRTARRETMTAADLRVAWERATRAVDFSAAFVWRGRLIEIGGELDPPGTAGDRIGGRGTLTLAAAPTGAGDGGPDVADGRAGADTGLLRPSLRRLAQWLAIPLVPEAAFGPLRIAGTFEADAASVRISDATVEADGSSAEGSLALDIGGERPVLRGALAFDALDLNPYAAALLPSDPTVAAMLALPLSAEQLPRADLDLAVSAEALDLGTYRFTGTRATLLAGAGEMALSLDEAGWAGGSVRGRLTVNPADEGLAVHLSARLDEVSVAEAGRPVWAAYSNELLGTDIPLRGTGAATVDLSAEGGTVGAMIGSLAGRVVADVRDGVVDGVDVPSTLDGLVDGDMLAVVDGYSLFPSVVGRVRFATLTVRMTVAAGIARADEIRLVGDDYEVTLSGEGDLRRREIGAEGAASLFSPESEGGSGPSRPVITLPFGVGGTIGEPVIVPGVPYRAALGHD